MFLTSYDYNKGRFSQQGCVDPDCLVLIGTKPSLHQGYLTFVDGTSTYDGVFNDINSTLVRDVHNERTISSCLALNSTGNVVQCTTSAYVICEKNDRFAPQSCTTESELKKVGISRSDPVKVSVRVHS